MMNTIITTGIPMAAAGIIIIEAGGGGRHEAVDQPPRAWSLTFGFRYF